MWVVVGDSFPFGQWPLSEARAMSSAPSLCLFPPQPLSGGTAVRRRGRPRGALRSSLARVIASGLSGCADSLAEHTGWPPEAVRRTLKELVRSGEAELAGRLETGHRGQQPGLFAPPTPREQVDAVAFARQVWR